MPWYQSVPMIGSAVALMMMILLRPSADARLPFTLLIGALVVLCIGLAIKDVTTGFYVASWLSR
jgi:hypothetical protein